MPQKIFQNFKVWGAPYLEIKYYAILIVGLVMYTGVQMQF